MRTITNDRKQSGSDFFVDFGQEPAHGRFPLRQVWQLVPGSAASLASLRLRDAEGNRSRFAIIRAGERGEILALNERALAEARRAVLRYLQWGEVAFAEPEVRSFLDTRGRNVLEPIMHVRVDVLRHHLGAVTKVLSARGVQVLVEQFPGRFVRLQGEARLASLLGFEGQMQSLGSASTVTACWLKRYQPRSSGFSG